MAFCGSCGGEQKPGAKFCRNCGAVIASTAAPTTSADAPASALDTAATPTVLRPSTPPPATATAHMPSIPPPPPPPPTRAWTPGTGIPAPPGASGPIAYSPPSGGSRTWIVVVASVVGVLAIAGVVVGVLLTHHGKSDDAGSRVTLVGAGGAPASQDTAPAVVPEEDPPPVAETQPVQHTLVGVVDITPVQSESKARKVAHTFDWYFSSINEGDYSQAAEALISHEAPHDPTTQDSHIVIRRLYYRGGQLVATITFTSHQAPRWAPDGVSRCVSWRLTFPVERSSNFLPYQLGRPIHVGQPYVSCGV